MAARILVIEDNPTSMELMVYLLQAFGYTTLTASDGEAGLNIVERELPDLVICDIELPGMSGYNIARHIRQQPALSSIPLVAVTAFAMVGDRERVMAAGFNGYIAKPIDPEVFVSRVEAFLQSQQLAAARTPPEPSVEQAAVERKHHATLLVVDNSLANLHLIHSILEPFGYKIVSASTIDAGLALARQILPDLIISDLHLPHKGGYDFIKAVKADAQLAGIPFIFLSASGWNGGNPAKGLSLGAARFLLRPIEPEALLTEVENCLREAKG